MQAIGLRNLHYALLTSDTDTLLEYEAPQPLIGAISAKINPTTNSETLYADDAPFDIANSLGDISLEIELATLPLKAQAILLGHTYENGVMTQADTDAPPYLAIGFMSRLSNNKFRFIWLLKGKFQLLEGDYGTMTDKPRWTNPKLKGTFVKRVFDGQWQAIGDSNDPDFVGASNWFETVHGATNTPDPIP